MLYALTRLPVPHRAPARHGRTRPAESDCTSEAAGPPSDVAEETAAPRTSIATRHQRRARPAGLFNLRTDCRRPGPTVTIDTARQWRGKPRTAVAPLAWTVRRGVPWPRSAHFRQQRWPAERWALKLAYPGSGRLNLPCSWIRQGDRPRSRADYGCPSMSQSEQNSGDTMKRFTIAVLALAILAAVWVYHRDHAAFNVTPVTTTITVPGFHITFAPPPPGAAPALTAEQAWQKWARRGPPYTGPPVRLGLFSRPGAGPLALPAVLNQLAYGYWFYCASPSPPCTNWVFLNANTGAPIG